ncbi:MAG: pyruvate, phosphate dikinase [Fidelibacterota bacterium]
MKYVYFFGDGTAEGSAKMRDLLGGKGANLAEMTIIGIPVPPGFTISTDICRYYYKNNKTYPHGLKKEVDEAIRRVEKIMNSKFGDPQNPLMFSVRSGAAISMPGMMDTVLNIGTNDDTIKGLIAKTGDERFAYDTYRRFVQMYGNVVMGVPDAQLDAIFDKKKKELGVKLDTDIPASALRELVLEFKKYIEEYTDRPFPEDAHEQLWGAIGAVFESWDIPRAVSYRRIHGLPDDMGTAVSVQAMVFGNMGKDCATGVAFTRDPATGENVFYGEYLINAQGEDVVAGTRTPQPVNKNAKTDPSQISLEEYMPEIYSQLVDIYKKIEKHYREMQDIEFTIQNRKLWMLQTRTGKRTAYAALKIAVDMVEEGLISEEEAVLKVEPNQLDQFLHPTLDPRAQVEELAKGLPASPGAASGKIIFDADAAVEWSGRGEKVILVRAETSPEDIHGMNAAQAILTSRGGMTSHAAVVARGMGKCCVAGCSDLEINYDKKELSVNNRIFREGDWISLDGATGRVLAGKIPTVDSEITMVLKGNIKPEDSSLFQMYSKLMMWADRVRRLGVRTNADTPEDAAIAVSFGAQGIGLCRTEHMFFQEDRIDAMREMIIAADPEGRKKALDRILPMQRDDFIGIFRAMDGYPVTIRTLDPPLHEFLPMDSKGINQLARKLDIEPEKLEMKVESLKEANPMLGHRGCRLGIVFPEITAMQARAIFEAACEVAEEGVKVYPEVMIPLVSEVEELRRQRKIVDEVARTVMEEKGIKVEYSVGTMIELPRAALTAHKIAEVAEFFSYGTNDLTQTVYGLSRDDSAKFLPYYIDKKIFKWDPFNKLDQEGVGELIKIGIEKGRNKRSNLKVGICGEHGGEPSSVEFCHRVGMDYVSCSPYRVPIARLAGAQAVLKEKLGIKGYEMEG